MDGFLMQQTDFPIEILIHDDCSTDGTTEIIREYEVKYPDLIYPLYEEENQYQKGKATEIDFYNYRRARGKYIAYCEGDDYWTDPLKLQKQVDFMEANPEYSVCFHNYKEVDVRNGNVEIIKYKQDSSDDSDILEVTTECFFQNSNNCRPLTILYRRSNFSFDWSKKYKFYRDTHEIYHLLREGKGAHLNFVGGVYHKHIGGVSSSILFSDSLRLVRDTFEELYLNNRKDKVLEKYYYKTILWNLNYLSNDILYKNIYKIFLRTPKIVSKALILHLMRKTKHFFK